MNPSEHVGAVTVLAPPSVTMHLPARWRSEHISKVGYLHRSMCSLVIYFVYLLHDCLSKFDPVGGARPPHNQHYRRSTASLSHRSFEPMSPQRILRCRLLEPRHYRTSISTAFTEGGRWFLNLVVVNTTTPRQSNFIDIPFSG